MLDRISSNTHLSAERKPLQLSLTAPASAIASPERPAPAIASPERHQRLPSAPAERKPLQLSASTTDASLSCATKLDEPTRSQPEAAPGKKRSSPAEAAQKVLEAMSNRKKAKASKASTADAGKASSADAGKASSADAGKASSADAGKAASADAKPEGRL